MKLKIEEERYQVKFRVELRKKIFFLKSLHNTQEFCRYLFEDQKLYARKITDFAIHFLLHIQFGLKQVTKSNQLTGLFTIAFFKTPQNNKQTTIISHKKAKPKTV